MRLMLLYYLVLQEGISLGIFVTLCHRPSGRDLCLIWLQTQLCLAKSVYILYSSVMLLLQLYYIRRTFVGTLNHIYIGIQIVRTLHWHCYTARAESEHVILPLTICCLSAHERWVIRGNDTLQNEGLIATMMYNLGSTSAVADHWSSYSLLLNGVRAVSVWLTAYPAYIAWSMYRHCLVALSFSKLGGWKCNVGEATMHLYLCCQKHIPTYIRLFMPCILVFVASLSHSLVRL